MLSQKIGDLRPARASVRASHANGARRRRGARESVWGSPRGASPSVETSSPPGGMGLWVGMARVAELSLAAGYRIVAVQRTLVAKALGTESSERSWSPHYFSARRPQPPRRRKVASAWGSRSRGWIRPTARFIRSLDGDRSFG